MTEAEIAVHALGRRPDFDSKEDAIVRVEAHPSRKRLGEFYKRTGRLHRLHLLLPPGSYLPRFQEQTTGVEKQPAAALPKWFGPSKWWLLAAALFLTAGGIAVVVLWTPAARPSAAGRGPKQPVAAAVSRSEVRIISGSLAKGYTDRLGHMWSAKYRKISDTEDSEFYLTSRQGNDFGYDVPLSSGLYELRLYFAECFYGEDNPEGGCVEPDLRCDRQRIAAALIVRPVVGCRRNQHCGRPAASAVQDQMDAQSGR